MMLFDPCSCPHLVARFFFLYVSYSVFKIEVIFKGVCTIWVFFGLNFSIYSLKSMEHFSCTINWSFLKGHGCNYFKNVSSSNNLEQIFCILVYLLWAFCINCQLVICGHRFLSAVSSNMDNLVFWKLAVKVPGFSCSLPLTLALNTAEIVDQLW
jgi:hypothetical protein